MKIRAIYRSFPDFLNCGILIIQILRQKLQKQIQFSTVKLVETVLFKNIEYYPILSNGIEYKSLDGQYLSYSWISIENQQDVFPQPRILVSTEPKWIDINEGVALIKKCAEAVAQIGLVKSIFDNVNFNNMDDQGHQILMCHINKVAKVSHLPFYRLFQMMVSCKLLINNSLTYCKRKLMLYINCLLQHLMVTKHAELLQVH